METRYLFLTQMHAPPLRPAGGRLPRATFPLPLLGSHPSSPLSHGCLVLLCASWISLQTANSRRSCLALPLHHAPRNLSSRPGPQRLIPCQRRDRSGDAAVLTEAWDRPCGLRAPPPPPVTRPLEPRKLSRMKPQGPALPPGNLSISGSPTAIALPFLRDRTPACSSTPETLSSGPLPPLRKLPRASKPMVLYFISTHSSQGSSILQPGPYRASVRTVQTSAAASHYARMTPGSPCTPAPWLRARPGSAPPFLRALARAPSASSRVTSVPPSRLPWNRIACK